MKKLILVALLVLLAWGGSRANAGEVYFEVGVHKSMNLTGCSVCWEDGDSPGAYFGLRYEQLLGGNTEWFAYATHLSNWTAGPPFNNDPESSVDTLGIGIRFNLSEM